MSGKRSTGSRKRRKRKPRVLTILSVIFLMVCLCAVMLVSLALMNQKTGVTELDLMKEQLASYMSVQKETATAELERRAAEEAERLAREEAERQKALEEEKKRQEEEAARLAEEKLLKAHPELGAEITYTLPSGDQVLDRSVIETWLTDNGDGTYTRNEEAWRKHIADYVDQMAKITDSVGYARTFGATGLGEITVAGSSYYGWEIDEAAEAEALNQALLAGYKGEREPVYLSKEAAKNSDNYGVGGDYVEIDLSRQHLWIYRDYTCVLETDIVSGLMDERHYTPEGIFWFITRETNSTLKGERLPNNTYSYEVMVAYWMQLTDDGVGLHDADWKWVFGGEEYIWNGSHGCINLPVDMAGEIFNLTSYDTPVVMYYSQPFELRPAPPSDLDNYYAALAARQAQEEAEKDEEDDEEDEEDPENPENPDDPNAQQADPNADPYAQQTDPYADPYAQQTDPYADPYAQQTDPYADPYAQQTDPYADPYAVAYAMNGYTDGTYADGTMYYTEGVY